MAQRRIEIPVKACGACERSYALSEWEALPLVVSRTERGTEVRRCDCDHQLELDVDGLRDLDLEVPAAVYYELFPQSQRAPFTRRRLAPLRRDRRQDQKVMAALYAICIALVLMVLGLVAAAVWW